MRKNIERSRGKFMSVKETKEPAIVRLDQAVLDDKGGEIVAHGWLNIDALQNLRVGDYQREILESRGHKSSISRAVEEGVRLPDIAPGGRQISSSGLLPKTLDTMAKASGLQNFRGNIHAYFEVLDEVWGLRGIKYTDRATNTRVNFMIQLAAMFSDHEDFWDGNKLVLDASQKAKLKSFPIDDPTIIRLAGAGSAAGILLYRYMVDHMNKGRQTSRHLTLRRMETYHKNRENLQKKGMIKK